MRTDPQIKLRLPPDLKEWVESEAEKYGSSLNSEIVRCIRERQETVTGLRGHSPFRDLVSDEERLDLHRKSAHT